MALRILLVEDSESDALLIIRQLRKDGYSPYFERVDTPENLKSMLEQYAWDLIITDHSMPCLNSKTVLDCLSELNLDIPVIIVSGIIPEEMAIATMKAGAQDYIMKANLARLAPAIERELQDASVRFAKKKAENTITHMAYHDALTGLNNRHQFEKRLQQVLETSWHSGQSNGLLYLDLDQFRVINDTCGHVAGDIFLKQISRTLREQVRDSDTLARLGGDEFGILLENCNSEPALRIAESVLDAIDEFRFQWQEKPYRISASIGFMEVSAESTGIDEIMRGVDLACYAAKESGGNRIRVYSHQDDDLNRREGEMLWVTRLNQALDENRFRLYEQAIVPVNNVSGGKPHKEFLIRLEDDDGNILDADTYIPAAEHYNLMPKIDRWFVRAAAEYLNERMKSVQSRDQLGVYFLSVSGSSLSDSFLQYVKDQLQRYAVPYETICFEINETAALAQYGFASEFIREIRKCGCQVALNDFGSGLSSFSYLKSVPVDFIKIDGSFVGHMVEDPMDCAIVEAINEIGHIAGLRTIAKTVDTDSTLLKLKDIGVDYAQGVSVDEPHRLERTELKFSA
ncbi:MAG: EAL domain-containing protein [Gammaproteobacteria bacterium]|nr:EAL domain-containing protein [Gammaproteobacteria bacterium]MDH5801675.1 EAL domain-containing protein [Gammaproteobacteria bacterium]